MKTIIKRASNENIIEAVKLLKAGEIVAIPTETVYGLAADALNPEAIEKIFTAKGRPRDNPLIVHVNGLEMAQELGLEITRPARKLAEKFWPGPLTMIFKKMFPVVSDEISCGLDTVAVRVPDKPVALEIIKHCGFALAAPSANTSGSPSPTKALHVYTDLNEKIPLIIDGGDCEIGLESTVIALNENRIKILRPGAVTPEQLSEFAEVIIDDIVYNKPDAKCASYRLSPGTMHKHYSPKAEVIAVITQSGEAFSNAAGDNYTIADPQAGTLFAELRKLDELGAKRIYVRLPNPKGLDLAVYNRLIRAAEFNILRI